MSTFAYKASDMSGNVVKGSLEADGEMEAVGKLQEMGYIPIRVQPAAFKPVQLDADLSKSIAGLFSRVSSRDVMLFTRDLAALLEAGLPIDRALSVLINAIETERFREIVRDILKSVQGGAYLSDAMSRHPRAFSDFYASMVRAGEAGGVLDHVLERLAVFLETSEELKEYIRSALVYPIFLLFVGGVSVIILLTFVIPKFSVIFNDLGSAIPLSTRILLDGSEWLRQWWWAVLIAVVAVIAGYAQYAKTPAGKRGIDQLKMRTPMVRDLVQKIEVARFARTLGTLVESGVPILQALQLVRDTIRNTVIASAMGRVSERVKEGDRLSVPLAAENVFPPMAVQMITVGEESGRLGDMLLRVAENYEKTVRNLVKRLINLLEPAMILVMGVVVGFIVISMLMAIFSVNEIPF